MHPVIDLRSDTVTKPTPEMRRAMAEAEVGDDVAGDDPSVNRLEAMAAEFIGKEAAMFVPSGTMGNLCALLAVTRPGEALICDLFCHSATYEGGSPSAVGGLSVFRAQTGCDGVLRPEHVLSCLPPRDVHYPQPSVVIVENTNNRAGGTCTSQDQTAAIAAVCGEHSLWLHIDGARICNSAVAQGVTPAGLAQPGDSVMFCLSKGLCAPVGSLLAGPRDFIEQARRKRKMLGGGMRQAGILAAAGIVALETMVDRLADDHAKAWELAVGLSSVPRVVVDLQSVQTNMVYFSVESEPFDASAFARRLSSESGVLCYGPAGRIRLVTHYDVPAEHIAPAVERIAQAVATIV